MKKIGILQNTIQEYGWGSRTVIAELLGKPSPSESPQAELWMGTHPKAPSLVQVDGRFVSLADVIAKNPEDVLGKTAIGRFGNRLPYLFKVLAAAQPLSIQAHPNKAQAKAGFAREERAGIPPDSPERNYRDADHKPECLCALTPFRALKGFRKVKDLAARMQTCCSKNLSVELKEIERSYDSQGLKRFFESLLTLSFDRREKTVQEALNAAQEGRVDSESCEWMQKLHHYYPDDIGVLAPLFLNLVCLEPGQAMFLPAGQMHSYLEGAGIELMANSDNVLRGGLTPKHVDIPELMNILDFRERPVSILAPVKKNEFEVVYESSDEEFVLSVICTPRGGVYRSRGKRSAEILLCTEGEGRLTDTGSGEQIDVRKGMSLLVPAAVPQYSIEGKMTIYKASVPIRG
ncbi:MAG: mannose-6-phosphate isomerase, class I [Desulfobacterales bacterium]|nr:mannose-6-phosphate isomerase, class I [Desulfobacterales bacterium]